MRGEVGTLRERERGGIRCHGRPVPPVERAVAVVTHVVTKHELPPRPPRPQRRRGPGRDGTGPRSRQEWTELYDRQRREATASGRPLEKHSSDPHHCIERRELAQAQRRVADADRATDIHPADAWRQWNGIPRDNEVARAVESRLPHVDGVLAVSDWTFAQVAKAFDPWEPAKGALAAVHLDRLLLRKTPSSGRRPSNMVAGGGNKLPYGTLPRLLLAWVCTEAVRTQSPELACQTYPSGVGGHAVRAGANNGEQNRSP